MNHALACLLLPLIALPQPVRAQALRPEAALDEAVSTAERSLREGETQVAESRYRDALRRGWLLLGTIDRLDGQLSSARTAFRNASTVSVEDGVALQALALVELQSGGAAAARQLLERLSRKNPGDVKTRQLLAQALTASGQTEQAARELEQARAVAPDDLELAFALATSYLRLKRVDDAAALFAQIARARPIPQTHVLVGRVYRDCGEYERARGELRAALRQDAGARRAHYYLGNVAVAEKGRAGLEEAIPEFQAELAIAPGDPMASLELGMALVDTQRPEEALRHLELAVRSEPSQARSFYYLGRAQLGAGQVREAAESLERALALLQKEGGTANQNRVIRNQLGQALQRLGDTQAASVHFAESQRLSAQESDAAREELARRAADAGEPEAATVQLPLVDASPLAALAPAQRLETRRRLVDSLARSYLNLGVMRAQQQRFDRAAEMFAAAVELDPGFPQAQSSLGIARFSAGQFAEATGPLSRALAAQPGDAGLRRALGMAWLNTQEYAKAAELLHDDPELQTDASLQFAYGLALVRSERASEAAPIFSRLLARQGDSAELSVLIGQAHAQQGDYASAIEALQHALRLNPAVADANGALGVIFLKQGRMAEAEAALRAELAGRPGDAQSQYYLAYVLDAEQRPDEAIPLLRGVLHGRPDFADARYLLGRVLLAQGQTAEAVEHLEAAARLAPDDANAHYQLGRAYTKLGRSEEAEQQFETFRQIKARR